MVKTKKISSSILTVLKVSFTTVGTIIGAGFASGKEVSTFLGVYGNIAYLACFLFGLAFCLGTIYFSSMDKTILSPFLKTALNICIFFSEFTSIIAMLAGLQSIFDMIFTNNIPYYISLVLIFLIIILGFNGLTSTNLILVPILVVSLIIFGIIGIKTAPTFSLVTTKCVPIFFTTSLPLYIGMSLFNVYPIAVEFSSYQTKKESIFSCIIASTLLTTLLFCFCFTILNISSSCVNCELPLIIYILDTAPQFITLSIITLAVAIITTIISDGFVVHSLIKKKVKKHDNIALLIIFIIAFLISRLGFSNIVENFYPIIGLIGTMFTLILIGRGIYLKLKFRKKQKLSTSSIKI